MSPYFPPQTIKTPCAALPSTAWEVKLVARPAPPHTAPLTQPGLPVLGCTTPTEGTLDSEP